MSIDITKTTGATATISWNPQTDDARGYLAQAIESGRLENALSALGTPAVEDLPTAQLRQITQSTASIQRDLERRTRAMVVQLKDRDGLSWAEIAGILYDDPSKRSSARAAYEAGLRQAGGFPAAADLVLLPGGFTAGQRVRVTSVPDRLSPDYIGCEGVIQEFNRVENSFIITGLTGRPQTEQVLGIPGFGAEHIEAIDDSQDPSTL